MNVTGQRPYRRKREIDAHVERERANPLVITREHPW